MALISAKEYRERQAPRDTIPLPSGGTIRLRRVDVLALAASGKVDAAAVDLLLSRLAAWQQLAPSQLAEALSGNLREVAHVMDAMVCAAALAPRIVPDAPADDADALWIDDVDLWDKLAILGAVGRLADRRTPPPATVATVPEPPAVAASVDLEQL